MALEQELIERWSGCGAGVDVLLTPSVRGFLGFAHAEVPPSDAERPSIVLTPRSAYFLRGGHFAFDYYNLQDWFPDAGPRLLPLGLAVFLFGAWDAESRGGILPVDRMEIRLGGKVREVARKDFGLVRKPAYRAEAGPILDPALLETPEFDWVEGCLAVW